MGSTVTTGRMAAAFRASSGAILYCLYEQTYEKNCFPHTPHWNAIYLGHAAGALRKVFDYASMCEGGMLQNRSGRITPEGYLRSWLAELHAPAHSTRDCQVRLYAKKDSFYAPLSQDALPTIAAGLATSGVQDAADELLAGNEVTLSLFEHGDIISRLCEDHRIPAWALLPDYSRPSAEAERCPSLGIRANMTRAAAPEHPPALAITEHGDMILRDPDGTWRCRGWPYDIVGQYVKSLAADGHGYPSNYYSLIRSFRDHLKTALKADPHQLIIEIDRTLAKDDWEIKRIEEAAALPGSATKGSRISIPFSTEHEYLLSHLPRAAVTWRVLSEDRLSLAPTHAIEPVLV